jgi:hypothetical protein
MRASRVVAVLADGSTIEAKMSTIYFAHATTSAGIAAVKASCATIDDDLPARISSMEN